MKVQFNFALFPTLARLHCYKDVNKYKMERELSMSDLNRVKIRRAFLGVMAFLFSTLSISSWASVGGTDLDPQLQDGSIVIYPIKKQGVKGDVCNFIVIGKRHLLTSAHCVETFNPGEALKFQNTLGTGVRSDRVIETVFRRDDYVVGWNKGKSVYDVLARVDKDIAVVRLAKEIDEFPTRPVYIAKTHGVGDQQDDFPMQAFMVSTDPGNSVSLDVPRKATQLPISLDTYAYRDQNKQVIRASFLAAALPQNSENKFCHGDSGGGVFLRQNNRIELVGVASLLTANENVRCENTLSMIVATLLNREWIVKILEDGRDDSFQK